MAIAIPCTKLMRIPESQQENRVTRLSIFPLLFGLLGLAVGQQPATKQDSSLCRVDSLPVSVQHGLRQDYASWKVQDVSGLSLRAHGRWESEKPLSCPGIAGRSLRDWSDVLCPLARAGGESRCGIQVCGVQRIARAIRLRTYSSRKDGPSRCGKLFYSRDAHRQVLRPSIQEPIQRARFGRDSTL